MPPRKPSGWRDGVKALGGGRYALRCTWVDPRTGKTRDTERRVDAESRADAIAQRVKLQAELAGDGSGMTVRQGFDLYLPTLHGGTKRGWESRAKVFCEAYGDTKLGDLKPHEVQRWLHEYGGTDGSAKNVRTALSGLYRYLRRTGRWSGANPIELVEVRKTPRSRAQQLRDQDNPPRRALLGDEPQRVLAALPDEARALNALQLFLGCRFGEVSALEWRDVNLSTGEVTIRQGQWQGELGVTKTGSKRATALGPQALAMMRAHRAAMETQQWPGWERYVFPRPPTGHRRLHDMWPYQTAHRTLKRALVACGIDVVNVTHVWRHTHVTIAAVQRALAVDSGVTAELHRQMTGHATEEQARAYIDVRALPASRIAETIEAALLPKGE